jgi:putative oxidoreductase
MISRPFFIGRSPTRRAQQPAAATLRQRHYSVAALQYAADFLVGACFPSKPRHVTNYARNIGGIIMLESLAAWRPQALSLLRIITGLLIIQHGMAKILGFPVYPAYANVQPFSLIGAAGFIELIGGALLIVGLCTRPVAFILAGEMAFAYFIGHFPKGFHPLINGGTLAALYCFTCLYLSTAGAGPWSADASMKKA